MLKQRFTSSRQTQGYSCIVIAMWTAATSMACSSQCLIVRTGYHHLGRIFQKSVNVCKLRYPNHRIINRFIASRVAVDQPKQHTDDAIRIVIPYKDQDAAVSVKRQLRDLSSKVQKTIQPVFISRKLKQDLSLREPKPNIVTQQCVVYLFKCDLCDAGYVGYTKGHLHTRVEGHRQKASSIYRHYCKEDNTAVPNNF